MARLLDLTLDRDYAYPEQGIPIIGNPLPRAPMPILQAPQSTRIQSLLDLLAARQASQGRLQQFAAYLQDQGMGPVGGNNPTLSWLSGAGTGTVPQGPGIFFNNQVDVLQPNDPRLRQVGNTELARPAARSLIDVLHELGLPISGVTGGYRSPQGQADIYAAKPGLAAPPGSSYHQEGLAIDLPAALQTARVERALAQAGWNRFSPSTEPWHWSFGVTG